MVGAGFAPAFAILGWWDVLFGSLASLLAAYASYKLKGCKWLVPMPPIIINAVIVGLEFTIAQHTPFVINALLVGAGQMIACYGLGMPLLLALEKHKGIFKQ